MAECEDWTLMNKQEDMEGREDRRVEEMDGQMREVMDMS